MKMVKQCASKCHTDNVYTRNNKTMCDIVYTENVKYYVITFIQKMFNTMYDNIYTEQFFIKLCVVMFI